MAKKNSAKKSVKNNNNTTSVWATVDRETNTAVSFFSSRSMARAHQNDGEVVRGFNLVPKR